jgi:MOSC domain-containing protein YiiM
MPGRLIGIARRAVRRAPMETLERGLIGVDFGLEGDQKGRKHESRRITVLAREDWEAALAALPPEGGASPWTTRRANLFVEGIRLPRAVGGVIQIGPVVLEVTGETNPCHLMEEALPGLLSALTPEWRGGVTCRVLEGGEVALGQPAEVLIAPVERRRVLP